jgi:hypothetical protein
MAPEATIDGSAGELDGGASIDVTFALEDA